MLYLKINYLAIIIKLKYKKPQNLKTCNNLLNFVILSIYLSSSKYELCISET